MRKTEWSPAAARRTVKLAWPAFGGWNGKLDSDARVTAMVQLLGAWISRVKRLSNWRFGALVFGAVVIGAVLSVVIGTDRKGNTAMTEPASSIVLADPLDPPEKRLPEPSAESERGAGSANTPSASATSKVGGDPKALASEGDHAKLTAAKEMLKARVLDGGASDSERRMLKALCRQLGDASCAN